MTREFFIHRAFLIACVFVSPFLVMSDIPASGSIPPLAAALLAVGALYFVIFRFKGSKILKSAAALCALLSAAMSVSVFVKFLKSFLLKDTPTALIALVFMLSVAVAAFCRSGTVLKFALMAFPMLAAVIIFNFLGSGYMLEWHCLLRQLSFEIEGGPALFVKYFICFSPVLLMPFMSGGSIGSDALGVALGAIFVVIIGFNVWLSGWGQYAYFSVINEVSVGALFSRITGFLYLAAFIAVFLKCSAFIKIIAAPIKEKGKKATAFASLAVFLLSFCF